MNSPIQISELLAGPDGLRAVLGAGEGRATKDEQARATTAGMGRVAHLVTLKKLQSNFEAYNQDKPLRDQVRGTENHLAGAILVALQQAKSTGQLIVTRLAGRQYIGAEMDPAGLADTMCVCIRTVKRNIKTLTKAGIIQDFGKGEGYNQKIGILADLVTCYPVSKAETKPQARLA